MPEGAMSLGIATSGISGSKSLLVIMQDGEGNALDYFVNVAESGHAPDDACWDSALEVDFSTGKSGSASRFLEGGKWVWYEAEITVGAANVKTDGGAKFNNTIDLGALPAAAIASVSITPGVPMFDSDVTVTAEVANATEVSLSYVVGSGSAVKVAMTESEGKYTATIPAQAANTVVKYTVSAVGQDGNTVESETGEYTVMGEVVVYDYTKLVLNELNGNAKYIEIYNSGDVEVDLAGCFIRKDNDAEGDVAIPSCKVAAKGYQIIACSGYAGSNTEIQYPNGLSAKKAVAIELLDPEKNSIDKFETANTIENKEASYSRVPDGDGQWYYAAPTEGAANGISTGVIGRNGLLVINEISGSDKKVEVYNGTDAEIKLEGYTFEKDGEVKWTGSAEETIAAGEYKVFEFNKNKTGAGYITSGFSGKKSVSLVLKDAEGKEVDAFIRGRMTDDGTGTLVWGEQSLEEKAEYSFSRISKGSWQYAEPSLGAANTEAKAEIKNN
ncbi:MAG: lamin tail domain-containing protein, partial [Bacteroidales bacterium]|nr:lamin tail domain-containing protein [Bacteroidales bacterium]